VFDNCSIYICVFLTVAGDVNVGTSVHVSDDCRGMLAAESV